MKLNKLMMGLGVVFALASTQSAFADNQTRNFNVKVSVSSFCEVGNPNDVDFSTIAANQGVDAVQSTNLSVKCNDNTPFTISLKPSNNSDDGVGQMSSSTGASITYVLSKDQYGFDSWGSGLYANTLVADGQENEYPIYVRIPMTEFNKPSGEYTDNVIVTVNF